MAKEGNLGKAVQRLQSLGMAEKNERTLDQLIGKHPTIKIVTSKQTLSKNTALKTSTECVLREIAAFAADSSLGRSPLRFEHLREAFNCSVPLVAQNYLELFGDHALNFSISSDRIPRHNDTRDLVFHACRYAGLSPLLETKGLSESSRHRGYLYPKLGARVNSCCRHYPNLSAANYRH